MTSIIKMRDNDGSHFYLDANQVVGIMERPDVPEYKTLVSTSDDRVWGTNENMHEVAKRVAEAQLIPIRQQGLNTDAVNQLQDAVLQLRYELGALVKAVATPARVRQNNLAAVVGIPKLAEYAHSVKHAQLNENGFHTEGYAELTQKWLDGYDQMVADLSSVEPPLTFDTITWAIKNVRRNTALLPSQLAGALAAASVCQGWLANENAASGEKDEQTLRQAVDDYLRKRREQEARFRSGARVTDKKLNASLAVHDFITEMLNWLDGRG